jgi:hypothetical protein
MDLDRISVALRPRAPREALDLGAVMLRANARAVWSAWFAFTLPIFVICNALGIVIDLPWLGLVLMWWLKPLFDRVPLYVLSRAVFDRAPGWRETLHGQARWGWRSTLAALSWLRIDSSRALRLPMELLEGAPRTQRAARWKVLRRRIVTDITLLTYGCLQFELVVFLSVCLLTLLLVPHEWRPESLSGFFRHDVRGASTVWWLLGAGLAYLAMSAIEPLYVACGFALYLNRRTQLEAWDIDLAFQRLRTRLQSLGKVLVVLMALGAGLPSLAHAATGASPAPEVGTTPHSTTSAEQVFRQPLDSSDQRFTEAATQAYRDPQFGGEKTRREWVFKFKFKPTQRIKTPENTGFGAAIATLLNVLLWLLLLAAVLALLLFSWRWRGRWVARPAEPEVPMTPDRRIVELTQAPLPDDLAAAARTLWQGQRQREALALLYRGCVEQTSRLLQIPLSPEATEADWLRKAASIADPLRAQRVAAIVRAWQFAAYAGRYPDDAGIESLLDGWPAQPGRSS